MRFLTSPIGLASLFILVAGIVASCAVPNLITQPNIDDGATQLENGAPSPALAGVPGAAAPADAGGLLAASNPPSQLLRSEWRTDFSRRVVEWNEIMSGGPPKDGIPAVDNPTFEDTGAAAEWLSERDPVMVMRAGDETRAYPLAILIWHEIVNDTVGGQAVAITFCPLCNASIVFDRNFDGQVLDFGTTGMLRNSDLIMYDRQTETWWQQFTGEGIVGQYAGASLTMLPSQVLSFGDFAAEFPGGRVLARPDVSRAYGQNPYTNYDSTAERPFLFSGKLDTRLPATERVAGVVLDQTAVAYPFPTLAGAGAINDEVNGTPLVVLHKPGVASALDSRTISEGRDVGSVAIYNRTAGERVLTFAANGDGTFRDLETGSTWTILGTAIDGELAGQTLDRILSFDHFWFAWNAFFPDAELYAE